MDENSEEQDVGSSSNGNNQNCKRQLYPAGTIYHLVPAYILKASRSNQEESNNIDETEQASSSENSPLEDDCYHPETSRNLETDSNEDDAFVLFSNMPQEAYSKIRVCRSMVMDHFVPRYKTAVESMLEAMDLVLEEGNIQDI